MSPTVESTRGRGRRGLRPGARVGVVVGLIAIVVACEVAVVAFTRAHGASTVGDEPWYLMASQALWNLHPPMRSVIVADFHNMIFSAFPPGTTIQTPNIVEAFTGPRGLVSPFEPGLPLLVAPFFKLGGELVARVGLMTLEVAGLAYLWHRVSALCDLKQRARALLALMFAAPAVLLATTQIYPDFVAGILMACALVELAIVERTGGWSPRSVVVVALATAVLPWLQIKNAAVGIVVILCAAAVTVRARSSLRSPMIVVGVVVLAWLILLAYNLRYFGRALGFPEEPSRLNGNAFQYLLGLLFGRDQGMLVQVPTTLVGLAGLWLARRRLPITVVTSVVVVGMLLLLNGTYTSNPYGGYSFQGRFEWSMVPLLVAWAGWAISRWQAADRSLWGPMALVGGAWVYQAVPILISDHTYYNAFGSWDPASYGGWWPGLDWVLPQFDAPGRHWGVPVIGLPVVILLAGIIVTLSLAYARPATGRLFGPAVLVVTAAGLVLLGLLVPGELPTTVLTFHGPVFGSGKGAPRVPLIATLPGSYQTSLYYVLAGGPTPGGFSAWCVDVAGSRTSITKGDIPPGAGTITLSVHCTRPGAVAVGLEVPSESQLTVRQVRLRKTAA